MELSYPNLDIAPEKITFHKVDVSGPLLGRDSLWFNSCKRPCTQSSYFGWSLTGGSTVVLLIKWQKRILQLRRKIILTNAELCNNHSDNRRDLTFHVFRKDSCPRLVSLLSTALFKARSITYWG